MLDHVVHTKERLEDLRSSLENALRVHDTLLGQQQNDDTKKISALCGATHGAHHCWLGVRHEL